MALSSYERENLFKTTVTWKSSNTAVDPSGSISYINVTDADGNYLIYNEQTQKDGTGIYSYKISTSSTDPLGLTIIDHWARFNYGGKHNFQVKHDKSVINLRYIIQ